MTLIVRPANGTLLTVLPTAPRTVDESAFTREWSTTGSRHFGGLWLRHWQEITVFSRRDGTIFVVPGNGVGQLTMAISSIFPHLLPARHLPPNNNVVTRFIASKPSPYTYSSWLSFMASDITPPGSDLVTPLTPPPTEEKASPIVTKVLRHLRQHQQGHRPQSSWVEYPLKPKEYVDFTNLLGSDGRLSGYVKDKVRYDYNPSRSRLTVRMPTAIHDTFCAKLAGEISNQLRQFEKSEGSVADFAGQIEHFSTSRINLPIDSEDDELKYSTREPDASFGHPKAQYPGVVIEICYSQKRRDVALLADDYILNTDGSIKVVVCVDIDYKQSQRATLSVWRPEYVTVEGKEYFQTTADVDAQAFRTDDGIPVEDTMLRLSLRDFATDPLLEEYADINQEVVITAQQLCAFLQSAEARQSAQIHHEGSVNTIRPGVLKRRRHITPSDVTGSDDEQTSERETKRGRSDSDYHPSSLSGESTI
ncbi:uncharacterized protein AFUA_7G08520 [Aspergillus fumigatus Af293]|uniref:Uncharacterized protein n=1 Tax=Aspergillus fumigatus (strain ATCC MYA-4609 / CBS 101355 / FGSC A1100 / Af293) TaxID=330879 RepID=Q4WH66_ASPFU|nr:hypothetical protein AFUA_7G08520 [Aspergillus fumigatus Af293]EAL86725.1 hypothetical protein AFUA_7G08520 [Aspergillus fumigatus Af293]